MLFFLFFFSPRAERIRHPLVPTLWSAFCRRDCDATNREQRALCLTNATRRRVIRRARVRLPVSLLHSTARLLRGAACVTARARARKTLQSRTQPRAAASLSRRAGGLFGRGRQGKKGELSRFAAARRRHRVRRELLPEARKSLRSRPDSTHCVASLQVPRSGREC